MQTLDLAWRQKLDEQYIADEVSSVKNLLHLLNHKAIDQATIHAIAAKLLSRMREHVAALPAMKKVIHAYPLNSREGLALMTLAEALLRIPDTHTAQEMISDKIHEGGWETEGSSYETLTRVTSNLMKLAGYFLQDADDSKLSRVAKAFLQPISGPVIHKLTISAIKRLNEGFIMGQDISSALHQAQKHTDPHVTFSFDMLGEAALTKADAQRYFDKYVEAIQAVGKAYSHIGHIHEKPGVSIKLSALHPRYEFIQSERVVKELGASLRELCILAHDQNIALAIDAEESYRLNLSLDLYARLFSHKELKDWEGCGFVVQAYQKRAHLVVDFLSELARQHKRSIPVRLVKGAYWDSEIKWAQQQGLEAYPVYTQKMTTDVSYIVCAQKLLKQDYIYPQFATHNPLTVATILHMGGERKFEFQRLQGMGEELTHALRKNGYETRTRIYAPVGAHHDLLPYLVRRLLENGANSSFVHQLHDTNYSDEQILQDPIQALANQKVPTNSFLPLPRDIYGPQRKNARGFHVHDPVFLDAMQKAVRQFGPISYRFGTKTREVLSPIDGSKVGEVGVWSQNQLEALLNNAKDAFALWSSTHVSARAAVLLKFADVLEAKIFEYMALAIGEAGKTFDDALAEVREAIDFCRYYANQAESLLLRHQAMPGPTGEENILSWHPRGVFLCISPWNFPLAIFVGQIAAALVTGNTVLAKPAASTPLIAAKAIADLHECGVPKEALQFVVADNADIDTTLISSPKLDGIVFTGSTETAKHIAQKTLQHDGALTPLIAETGGQNVMIVDSSALHEQVVLDVMRSAFRSAGQRCSALRILYLQNEIADSIIRMLTDAMAELNVGDPRLPHTDIGPVISLKAQESLQAHKQYLHKHGKLLYECSLPKDMAGGTYVAPAAFEIPSLSVLKKEQFGPILHVIRYDIRKLDAVVREINETGYGLTMGLHTRVPRRIKQVAALCKVGNLYVNRDMIGAVVGVQPFGGEGLSGTGFKAGGPHYLMKFLVERVRTTNLTAQGGNVTLLTQNHK